MKVLKFGGTSVASSKSLKEVITILRNQNAPVIVVVSALGGITDVLVGMLQTAAKGSEEYKKAFKTLEERHLEPINAFLKGDAKASAESFLHQQLEELQTLLDAIHKVEEMTPKSVATISSFGEFLSSTIIEKVLQAAGLKCQLQDARTLIQTKMQQQKEVVDFGVTAAQVQAAWKAHQGEVLLVPGFIAANENGQTTTLGRGGSDYSAAIIAHVLEAEELEIWTDVSGMYTAHPKIVPTATPIEQLTYFEAMELSHFGAKVIYPPTLQPLVEKNIPIRVKNTFDAQAAGSLINGTGTPDQNHIVKGISHIDGVALISLEGGGMVGIPGFSKRLFEALSENKINIIMITQASSEYSICLGIREGDAPLAKEVIDAQFAFEIAQKKVAPAKVETNLVNIAVVGDRMKDHQGISGKLFSTLGANNINIRAIAQGASERNISIIIDAKNVTKALNALHESFFETQRKQLNLFVMGVGNVGGKLLEQIHQQTAYLKEQLQLSIRVMGISNSRKMILGTTPIDLNSWKNQLEDTEIQADKEKFFEHVTTQNLRNSIFVDNTANEIVAQEYYRYLNNSIGVVTCNKIACASTLEHYLSLKKVARQYNSPFLFETNVGAGLPVIDTLNNLIASGDKIIKIQAVLSGSLNFIFNTFTAGVPFHEVVQQAREQGYTEPDPKIDLSGIDVARKILILARESGLAIELEDIANNSFLPEACLNTSNVEDFFESLATNDAHFQEIVKKAEANGAQLKYVAQLENGKASVGLQEVPEGHDFYNLSGSDNIILFYTNRYKDQPLIVKGAGAGAEVTASGLFADIIRIGKQ